MIIECILRRNPPTLIHLGAIAYQFQPDDQGRHVCEVEDQQHIARLLSISEAYRLPGDQPVPAALIPAIVEQTLPTAAAVFTPVDENVLKGSTVHPETFDLGGESLVEIADVVAHAHDLSGLTTYEWNHLPDEDRHTFIDLALDDLDKREPADKQPPAAPVVAEPAKSTPETASGSGAGNSNGDGQNANQADTAADGSAAAVAELESARAAYKELFGKAPHHTQNAARIRELIAAKVAEGA